MKGINHMPQRQIELLRHSGFLVGDRVPGMNRAFSGRFMVAEPPGPDDPYPTDDASDGRYCVVGDNLVALAAATIEFFGLSFPPD